MITRDNENLLVGHYGMIYTDCDKVLVDSVRAYQKLAALGISSYKDYQFLKGEEMIFKFPKEAFKAVKKIIKVPRTEKEEGQLYKRFTVSKPL
jgi:hypothetical protein